MHIAILTGGISSERSVALRSAENMKHWIQIAGYTSDTFDFPDMIPEFLSNYQTFDLVIPMFHGIYGEDGQITAFLRTLGCQYAFSPFTTHALCLDKYRTNLFVEAMGIHIPRTLFLPKDEPKKEILAYAWVESFPYIIKPNRGGSSIATYKVETLDQLHTSLGSISDDDILIQECIEGREFTVGIYRDASGHHALPIIEIITPENRFFDYEEKYETDGSNEIFLEGEKELMDILRSQSEMIASMLHCRGVVRIDWRYDGKDIYFLEVNTIPGFTEASLIPKMWKKTGKNKEKFIKILSF